jgi:hypothetical protein
MDDRQRGESPVKATENALRAVKKMSEARCFDLRNIVDAKNLILDRACFYAASLLGRRK